jgi:hypothetical protein
MADGDQRIRGIVDAGQGTTSGVATRDMASYDVPNDTTCLLIGKAVAQEAADATAIMAFMILAVANSTGGNVTIRGSNEPADYEIDADVPDQNWTLSFEDGGGNKVVLQGTGGAGDTVRWHGSIEVVQVEVNL